MKENKTMLLSIFSWKGFTHHPYTSIQMVKSFENKYCYETTTSLGEWKELRICIKILFFQRFLKTIFLEKDILKIIPHQQLQMQTLLVWFNQTYATYIENILTLPNQTLPSCALGMHLEFTTILKRLKK